MQITPRKGLLALCLLFIFSLAQAQIQKAPDRKEGEGPFKRLIIRGVTLINGNGAPPIGPVDIVIEGNKITKVDVVGYPGVDINANRRPKLEGDGIEVDAEGFLSFVLECRHDDISM